MKLFFKTFIYSVLAFYSASGQNLTAYKTLKYSDIARLNIKLPYLRYYGPDSSLIVYGSSHTTHYDDPQIEDIQKLISKHRPTIILYEGDGITKAETKAKTVSIYSEMGLAKYLADSLNIQSLNIEPDTKGKFKLLLTKFSLNEILLATLGLQITMMQYENEDFESKFPFMVKSLIDEGLPLSSKQQTLNYFYNAYKSYFSHTFSYDHFDSRTIQAKYDKTTLNKVNQAANEFRDKHIIALVNKLVSEKQKVFLLVGGWHAIVCEPAFESIVRRAN